MQLLHLLPLASLALALPHTNIFTKRQGDSCISQEWNVQQYSEFTAGSTSPAGGPSAFTDSTINFLFADPNFDIQYNCDAEAETGQSLESIIGNVNFCDGGNMSFQYFGQGSVELQRTGVACGNTTWTESGGPGSLSLECYPLFGGQQCETVTQVNFPVSFLEQTN